MAFTWTTANSKATGGNTPLGNGVQSGALCVGGNNAGPITTTEQYNGSTWASGGNLVTGKNSGAGGGSTSAAIAMGGDSTDAETYNGTSWSAITASAQPHLGPAGYGGTQSDGCIAAGRNGASANTAIEVWNGSSWSTGGTIGTNVTRGSGCAASSSTVLKVSGDNDTSGNDNPGSNTVVCEKYNGTSWSATGSVSTARIYAAGSGVQSDAWVAGGRDTSSTTIQSTEIFNGTSWSAGNNYAGGVWDLNYAAGNGTANGLAFGNTTRVEQFTTPVASKGPSGLLLMGAGI